MNNDWKNFLSPRDASHDNNASDNAKAIKSTVLCDLSQYSTLVIAGDDAVSFMQGQFTNDVEKIDADNSQMNGFCNKKGRMIANFRLFKHQQNHFLSIKNDLVDLSIEHLQHYILRAHVAVQDVSEQLIHLGLSGPDSPALLAEFIKTVNEEVDSVSYNDNYIAIRVAGLQARYEIFCSLEHAKTLWEKLSAKIDVIDASSWDYLNIQAGLPYIDSHTSGEFVPQMVNMELINGVSFTKGCFTGQEIVARMHYLGKLKKRCYKIHIATEDRPNAGDKLFAENARAGQNTGAIIMAEKNPESGYDALAVIQIADTESKLFLYGADGPTVFVRELPYSFDSE
jgi:folate-binding protein YgfZ